LINGRERWVELVPNQLDLQVVAGRAVMELPEHRRLIGLEGEFKLGPSTAPTSAFMPRRYRY
jgi:hypothetical protein